MSAHREIETVFLKIFRFISYQKYSLKLSPSASSSLKSTLKLRKIKGINLNRNNLKKSSRRRVIEIRKASRSLLALRRKNIEPMRARRKRRRRRNKRRRRRRKSKKRRKRKNTLINPNTQ